MAAAERWYFDLEQIHNTPSIKCGYDHDKELSCRQQAANFIQDMGQRLQVNQLCINTAIVYMHRFYMFHSFTRFHRTALASAALFLAAKVEEQPRKLEHVIRFSQICLHRDQAPFDVTSAAYNEQVQDLIMNENILLQTLGFDVAIDHPHTHIVRCCQLVRASKDLAQTSYFMASYSLHLTTMCLQYKPTVVACFCIHLACKWSNWEIPESSEGKPWFWYVDKSVTSELLENLTAEFLNLFEKCPSRLKKKIMALSSYSNIPQSISNNQPPYLFQQPTMTQQQELDKRKENRLAVESHNPLNAVPHPIGPQGAIIASVNAMNSGGPTHPFFHQNTMNVVHHGVNMSNSGSIMSCSSSANMSNDEVLKKRSSEHVQQRLSIVPPTIPPPNLPDTPFKKHHHPTHHQRDSHSGSMPASSNKPSCMFDGVQPPPSSHKVGYLHQGVPPTGATSSSSGGHINPPPVHMTMSHNSSVRNHVKVEKVEHPSGGGHRSSRPQHARNGEAHFTEKKYEVKREVVDVKPQVLGPPPPAAPPIPRVRPKTPPQQLNLLPTLHQVKQERSIFSPEEKAVSPPPLLEKIKSSPPPTPRTPVELKRESPESESEQQVQVQTRQMPQETKPRPNNGDKSAPPIVSSPQSQPPLLPDTTSKSSHKKKKKKHKEHKEKHKDKHKHKHKVKDPEPIVITIPKDKITISHPEGLKIKIAKDKISNPSTGLKLKISKDKLKETKKRGRCEEDDDSGSGDHLPTKHHRPNGTTALQVNNSCNDFSSLLGSSLVSPIRTPAHFSNRSPRPLPHSSRSEDSPLSSPVVIPRYSPTESGPSNHSPIDHETGSPCLSPIMTPGHSSGRNNCENHPASPTDMPNYSPTHTKPCLSPIAATPRYSAPMPKSYPVHSYHPRAREVAEHKPPCLPISSSHSSPNSDCETETKTCISPIQTPRYSSPRVTEPVGSSSPILTPGHSPNYRDNRKCVSPIQTPMYHSDRNTNLDLLVTSDSCNNVILSSSPVITPGHSPNYHEKPKICLSPIKTPSPERKDDTDPDHSPGYSAFYESNGKRKACLSPISTPLHRSDRKSFLSPIQTPSWSLPSSEIPREKSLSPAIVPRYSPTDPHSLGAESLVNTSPNRFSPEHCRDTASPESVQDSSPVARIGPRTPPSPQTTSYLYNPITPLRPDPSEIVFKDSNDNHTKLASNFPVHRHERQYPSERRNPNYGEEKRQRKPPLLPDFKIPRMSGQNRRHFFPGDTGNSGWGCRGRGRGIHPAYGRVRGGMRGVRPRWEPPLHFRPRPPLPHHHQSDISYHEAIRPHHNFDGITASMSDSMHQQPYDSSLMQGNAYDAAVMKHAYETMGMGEGMQYYLPYPQQQQLYVHTFPPPPPLPDEPPPPPPPPPPPS